MEITGKTTIKLIMIKCVVCEEEYPITEKCYQQALEIIKIFSHSEDKTEFICKKCQKFVKQVKQNYYHLS